VEPSGNGTKGGGRSLGEGCHPAGEIKIRKQRQLHSGNETGKRASSYVGGQPPEWRPRLTEKLHPHPPPTPKGCHTLLDEMKRDDLRALASPAGRR